MTTIFFLLITGTLLAIAAYKLYYTAENSKLTDPVFTSGLMAVLSFVILVIAFLRIDSLWL
jgi:hypothetical protein